MTTSRSDHSADGIIRIAAAVIVDGEGRTLLVRKRGTRSFMQPGGKFASGESPYHALVRELQEELGCTIEGAHRPLGRFSAPAANEPGLTVEAELFAIRLAGEIRPAAEIDQAIWYDAQRDADVPIAPLTRDHVLPWVRSQQWRELLSIGTIA